MATIVKVTHGTAFEVEETLLPCACGAVPKIEIAYGRTPYIIVCQSCGNNFHNDITNCDASGAIKYYNEWVKDNSKNKFNIEVSNYKTKSSL